MLLRKLFRTARKYKAQFISMVIMVAIGMGVFIGANVEWYTLLKNGTTFMTETKYADYRLYNENGFSEEDVAAVRAIEGVTAASRILNVNVDVKDSDRSLALFVPETYGVSVLCVTEGEDFEENSDGFYLSDKFAKANDLALGDELTLTYRNAEIKGKIVGLAKSAEFMMCVAGENQLMPDYTAFGFVYASAEKIKTVLGGRIFYPQINVRSDVGKTAFESAVNDVLGKTTLVLTKNEHASYSTLMSEVNEGQTMASILPVMFLLIGILTMVTTMHRITANEKTQIGTLKALGFKNRKILAHYTSYGFFIGLVGTAFGILFGYGMAAMIVNPNAFQGTYFDMPVWSLRMPLFIVPILVAAVAFLTLIGFLSVKKTLKGTAADALRPYTPKKIKPLAVEKTKAWNKIGFATKWNLRDVVRHKTRSFMTLAGIVGCMILLVGGLGMQDTMSAFLGTIDKQILNYEIRVNFTESITNEEAVAFAERYEGDTLAASSVQLDDEAVTLEVYNIRYDTVRFTDKKSRVTALSDDGVYICMRLADKYKVGDTIVFSPYGSEKKYSVKVAGVLRSFQTKSITMTEACAARTEIPYKITSAFLNRAPEAIGTEAYISGTQTKAAIMKSYDGFLEIMNAMVFVFVGAAIVLGAVVLYNLGVMSYVERSRELATLKVVGFKNKQIGKILVSQNIWLSVLGILIGLPAGMGALQLLITMLAGDYELKMALGAATYCVSILVTFGVSLVVGLLVSGKNKKIDMVEALKGAE